MLRYFKMMNPMKLGSNINPNHHHLGHNVAHNAPIITGVSIPLIICSSCKEPFDSNQQIVNAKGETFHTHCFV